MRVAAQSQEEQALRAEHDALAERLAARASVDDVRRGFYAVFFLVITVGLAAKLAYDRWGPYHPRAFKGPPFLVFLALAAALVCAVVAAVSFARGRRKMRAEEAEFTRLRSIREKLGLGS
jgi:hypothetical protein